MNETLSPRQRAAVVVLADPERVAELGTLGRLAGACRVNVRTLRRWYLIPEFGAAIREEAGRHLDAHLGRIYEAMISKAVDGDVPAARLVLECRGIVGGRAAPAVAVNVNEAPHEVLLSWDRVERGAALDDRPERDPEDELLDSVALEARQAEGGRLVDPVADSARKADELKRRAALEEERATKARKEREEAEQAERERRLKVEIDARTASLRASEPYEVRPPEDW